MSEFYNKYPYTDFHELNLDWIIERVKQLTEDWISTKEAWEGTEADWQELYNYVHDYFDNLDVQDEINVKINVMIADGTFETIVTPIIDDQVADTVAEWLAEHITPTTPAVDDTLTVEGAAADAAATGDQVFRSLKGTNFTISHNNLHSLTDADTFPTNQIMGIDSNILESEISHLPVYGKTMLFISMDTYKDHRYAGMQYAIELTTSPKYYIRTCLYEHGSERWNSWQELHNVNDIIALIQQYALSSSNYQITHGNLHGISDADNIKKNSVLWISGTVTESDVPHLPEYFLEQQSFMITVNGLYNSYYGAMQIYYGTLTGNIYTRSSKYNASSPEQTEWTGWKKIHDGDGHQSGTYTFTASRQIQTTSIYLKSGITYGIYTNNFGERINIWAGNDTGNYISSTYYEYIEFTPSSNGLMNIFNADGKAGSITVDVYSGEAKKFFEMQKRIYTVGPDGDYAGPVACFKALSRDNFEKIIYIEGGEYDIWQEYADNNIPVCPSDVDPVTNFIPYNVFVPTNSHIIGKGNVIFKFMPDASDISFNEAYAASPLNVLGSCIIENITVHCKNGRYCLHDDCMYLSRFNGSVHKYKNVTLIKEIRENGPDSQARGTTHTTGFGFNPMITYDFENCTFINKDAGGGFYGHNRSGFDGLTNSKYNSPTIIHNNSIIDTAGSFGVILDNSVSAAAPGQQIRASFTGCYLNHEIHCADASNRAQGNNANVYDITMLNSSNVTVNILDSGNTYTPKIYDI